MALPSGYRRLKCIRSTGTQHLDLGFQPNQDTRIVVDFQTLEVNGETHIASARSSGSTPLYTLFFGSTGKYGSRYGTSATQYLANVTGIGRHVLDKNKNVTSADGGEAVTAASETFTVGSSLTVFARNDGTGVNGHISGELYSLQAYAAVVMIRDLIPALRISDSKPGAYDDVTGEFLTNAGTGEFEYEEITPTGDHRTMVDGVIWGVPSGRCLVDGVGYSIKKGRTLVDGVGYDIDVDTEIILTISGTSTYIKYVKFYVNETLYPSSASEISIKRGDIIRLSSYYTATNSAGGGGIRASLDDSKFSEIGTSEGSDKYSVSLVANSDLTLAISGKATTYHDYVYIVATGEYTLI